MLQPPLEEQVSQQWGITNWWLWLLQY